MFAYLWPIVLVILSNVFYHICAKSVPNSVSPFAALTITYIIGAVCSTVMFFITSRRLNIIKEFASMNWAPYILGIVVAGLEVGFIYAYKAGWQVSTASIVQSAVLSIILVFVGFLLYNEALTYNKIIGIIICFVGLVFINLK